MKTNKPALRSSLVLLALLRKPVEERVRFWLAGIIPVRSILFFLLRKPVEESLPDRRQGPTEQSPPSLKAMADKARSIPSVTLLP
jgi:hypothetical protein